MREFYFMCFGIFMFLFMIFFVYSIHKISKVKINKKDIIIFTIFALTGLAIFSIVVITRKNPYIWDYSYYYTKQLDFLEILHDNRFQRLPLDFRKNYI